MGSEGPVQDGGFAVVSGVFDSTEIRAIGKMIDATPIRRSRAGARHLMGHRAIVRLARDCRLLSVARRFLGGEPIPFRATLFDKSMQRNWLVAWHQDTALPLRERRDVVGWGPWSVKGNMLYAHAPAAALARVIALRVHIDDSRSDNGPLRVLPGTHRKGVLSDAEVGEFAASIQSVDCLATAGGVVMMRPLLIHASSKAASNHARRVLHIEYAERLDIGDGLALAIV